MPEETFGDTFFERIHLFFTGKRPPRPDPAQHKKHLMPQHQRSEEHATCEQKERGNGEGTMSDSFFDRIDGFFNGGRPKRHAGSRNRTR
jgi:hypothetical protein